MDGDLYLVSVVIALSLISGRSTLPTDGKVGAMHDKRVELFSSHVIDINDSFIVHPFECEVDGLSKDEIDGILAGTNLSMLVTVLDGSNNDSYTLEKDKGEQLYNLELTAVSNTLFVKGHALLNNSNGNINGSSLDGTRCELVFQGEGIGSGFARAEVPIILSTYNHVVLMNGAPEQIISCSAQGHPPPQIRWFGYNPDADARIVLEKNPKHSRNGETTSYLLFSQVTNETSGNYTCLAENLHGTVQKTFEVEVISVEAINPHCNDLDDSPFASSKSHDHELLNGQRNIQEILRRSKRHLWYQWRGQKIYIPPFNKPFDPPNHKSTDSDLQKMVNNMTERLLLADKVAVNKWDTGTPVEDVHREQIILDNMVRQAQNKGLDPSWARKYFRDQIEANKDIQYELIRIWNIQGKRPPGPPVDLGNEIRPKIDEINDKLMKLAAATEAQRREWNCKVEIEKNARFATFVYSLVPLHQKALEKSVKNICISLGPFPPRSPQHYDYPHLQFYPQPSPGPF